MDLECVMRQKGFWGAVSPPPEAMASTQPFCIDTLCFPEWVQFVFIAKLRLLAESASPLPAKCDAALMAEEYFRGLPQTGEWLKKILKRIDMLISET